MQVWEEVKFKRYSKQTCASNRIGGSLYDVQQAGGYRTATVSERLHICVSWNAHRFVSQREHNRCAAKAARKVSIVPTEYGVEHSTRLQNQYQLVARPYQAAKRQVPQVRRFLERVRRGTGGNKPTDNREGPLQRDHAHLLPLGGTGSGSSATHLPHP